MNALILIDLQNDFLPSGPLPSVDGDRIIPIVNRLVSLPFDIIIATKDWHPANHGSFATNHNKKPGERVVLAGIDQILWPVHCVQGSKGAEFCSGWDHHKVHKVIYKGMDKDIDSYSAFYDNGHIKSTGLGEFLKEKKVKEVYIAGLVLEYCVLYSALDAAAQGFKVGVVQDACSAAELHKGDSTKAVEEMKQAGIDIVQSTDLLAVSAKRK